MAEVTVPLMHGLRIGEAVHTEAVLREPEVEDLIEAGAQSERVVEHGGEVHLVRSPTLSGLLLLGRQIVRVGDHAGPLGLAELRRLKRVDLALLQVEAEKLDQLAAVQLSERLATRGRPDPAR